MGALAWVDWPVLQYETDQAWRLEIVILLIHSVFAVRVSLCMQTNAYSVQGICLRVDQGRRSTIRASTLAAVAFSPCRPRARQGVRRSGEPHTSEFPPQR